MEILENFALNFQSLDALDQTLFMIGFTTFGFILALVEWSESTYSLGRVPYFFLCSVVTGVVFASSIVNLLVFDAMKAELLWVLVFFIFGVKFAAGFAFGILAHARSISGYGHGGRAWLAPIPLIGFILAFKRPLDWQASSIPEVAFNVGAVVLGIGIMVAGSLVERRVEQSVQFAAVELSGDPVLERVRLQVDLRREGLEATLLKLAAEIPSQKIDESSELIRVDGDRTTLRYFYLVSRNMESLPNSMRSDLIHNMCTLDFMRPLIDAGATIEHVYMNSDRNDIGTVRVTSRICGS